VHTIPSSEQQEAELLVNSTLDHPGSHSASDLVRVYGRRIPSALHESLVALLQSAGQLDRVFGVVHILLNTCYGADTMSGCVLSAAMWQRLRRQPTPFPESEEGQWLRACTSALTACIYSHMQEGKWSVCPEFLAQSAVIPKITSQRPYWDAPALVARMYVASNRIADAKTLLDGIPFVEHEQATHVELAWGEYREFVAARYTLEERRPTEEQANTIWARSYSENVKVLRKLAAPSERNSQAKVLPYQPRDFEPLAQQLEDMLALSRSSLSFEQKYARLARATDRWRAALFRVLSPLADPNHVCAEWGQRVLTMGGTIHADPDVDEQTVKSWFVDLDKARHWSLQCGDWHRFWMLSWTELLIVESRSQFERMDELVQALIKSLSQQYDGSRDREARSNIANFLPGLSRKVCKLHDQRPNPALVFAATELRKSRSLISASTSSQAVIDRSHYPPDALGARTHYLSYTVFHRDDRIQACLYSADGQLSTERINVNLATIAACKQRFDPNEWLKVWGDAHLNSPRTQLASLIAPLAQAIESGRIQAGDHVCISADDPVHLVPLHYLPLLDKTAVEWLSMSRVASFADACALAIGPQSRPTHAIGICIHTVSKSPELQATAFNQAIQSIPQLSASESGILTAQEVIDKLQSNAVIHIHAHGFFHPLENPYTHSGLVVSDGHGLPMRDGDASRLLTPSTLVGGNPSLANSHVTLSACVSGLGLEGKGGDILGLEMALRLAGASSVLASHWQVRTQDAGEFSAMFYRYWLQEGRSRAAAWREAIRSLMRNETNAVRAAEWSAFSLFGAWQ
jgi:CHAT domain-containing protein